MSLAGNDTPNRIPFLEPMPAFVVVSGTVVEETAPAAELTRRLVLAWLEGLRDLRNSALAPFYAETPRSRLSSVDAEPRYQVIVDAAAALETSPVTLAEFTRLFLPSTASTVFLESLLRMGLEAQYVNDLQTVDEDVLTYRNPVTPVLVGQQELLSRPINPTTVASILEEIDQPSLVTETQHFADDFVENDAIDADIKAHERLFKDFFQYIQKLLLLT